jgi:hypothetical protein
MASKMKENAGYTWSKDTKDTPLRKSTFGSLASTSVTNCSNAGWGMLWIIFDSQRAFSRCQGGAADLGGVIEHINIHTLVWKDTDLLTTQIGEKVDPECISSLSSQLANFLDVQVELPQEFKRSRREGVRFRRTKPFWIPLYDQAFHFLMSTKTFAPACEMCIPPS